MQQVDGRVGDHRAGREDGGGAGRVQLGEVAGRDHATDHDHDVRPADGGQRVALDLNEIKALIESACAGLGADVKADPIVAETMRNLYDGVPIDEVYKASILAARTMIEKEPDYTYATARLLMHTIAKEVLYRANNIRRVF